MLIKSYTLLFAHTKILEEYNDLKRVEIQEPEQVGEIRALTEKRARRKAKKLLKKYHLNDFGFSC